MQKKILISLSVLGFLALANSASAATLKLSPASGTVSAGQTLSVDIMLDTTGAAVDGVDVYSLHYNKGALEVQDANTSASGIQITPGTLLPVTLTNTVNASTGVIQFSQVSSGGSSYTGSGKLATIVFKGLANGTSPVTFDFTNGSTSDTNVAGGGQDKLTSVTNGSYTVSGASTTAPPPTPPPTPTTPPPPVAPPSPTNPTTPGASPTPVASGSITSNLSVGSKGGEVTLLQTILVQGGYLASTSITGYFGTITEAAVKKYQCDKAIVCSGTASTTGYGMVGVKTRAALNGGGVVVPTPTPTTPTPTGTGIVLTRSLYYGMKGDDVKLLQEHLIASGYMGTGYNTGYFGNLTQSGVRKYQCAKAIVCDGIELTTGYGLVGPRTRAALSGV